MSRRPFPNQLTLDVVHHLPNYNNYTNTIKQIRAKLFYKQLYWIDLLK